VHLVAVRSDTLSIHHLSQSKEAREVEDGKDESGKKSQNDEERVMEVKIH
jgi:hypothetical protein